MQSGGSWLLDRFAGFRTTTIYMAKEPSPALFEPDFAAVIAPGLHLPKKT
jgi:hypothetical protein